MLRQKVTRAEDSQNVNLNPTIFVIYRGHRLYSLVVSAIGPRATAVRNLNEIPQRPIPAIPEVTVATAQHLQNLLYAGLRQLRHTTVVCIGTGHQEAELAFTGITSRDVTYPRN